MKREQGFKWIIKAISRYFSFFIIVAFVVTCCMLLFISIMSYSLNIELTSENIEASAKLTFLNVILISLILTIIDTVRRKISVDRPVRKISEATEKIIQGDFNVRLQPVNKLVVDDNLNEIIDSINKMAKELSSVETLRTDFIANVSHEMKTPLAVIQNYGTLLQSEGLSEEKRVEYSKVITEASRRLSDMITNILRLVRLENQQIYPNFERYNLGEQLCECLLQFESVWESSEIEIETEIEDDVIVNADAELLSLVWNNLLSNAFKFTEKGGRVSVSLRTEEEYAVVRIKDTGCGMRPEVGSHIFEKFYQGDPSHATKGNGLGLALVRRVVDIVKADIEVESVLGKGTAFTVKIKGENK